MTIDPFPEVRTRVELEYVPEGRFVECVACVGHELLDDESDPHAWAKEHESTHPGHGRFRIVAMTNFRVVPAGIAEPAR